MVTKNKKFIWPRWLEKGKIKIGDSKKGMSVKVTGMMCSGTYLHIKVESGVEVITTGHDALDVTIMINTTWPPIKNRNLPEHLKHVLMGGNSGGKEGSDSG